MRIRPMSDLHIEFFDFEPIEVPADVIVLAGDILTEAYGFGWAREQFPDKQIIYVLGNHEFYDAHYETVILAARREAAWLGIHFLERDELVIEGVRFLGTTLWTDFEVELPETSMSFAMWYARKAMTDFSLIRYQDRMLGPEDTREFHRISRAWLAERLAEPFEGETAVVTHHLPHKFSIDRQFHRHPLNPRFRESHAGARAAARRSVDPRSHALLVRLRGRRHSLCVQSTRLWAVGSERGVQSVSGRRGVKCGLQISGSKAIF
jgi:hypothetical protein